jgi:signal transduction histidine kinase
MTPDQAAAMISSQRSADRRLAGREVSANPKLVDRAVIEAAYHHETVPQIRQQFGAALKALNAAGPKVAEPDENQAKAIYEEALLRATRTVTERILHQLNPLIGDIEQAAQAEIAEYSGTKTQIAIGQIQLQAMAIVKLYNASKPKSIEEFDLAAAVRHCLPHDLEHQRCRVSFAGVQPTMVQGDPALIAVAVTNVLRNAIEASLPVATDNHKPPIIVNWGMTDRENWISIIDEGIGFGGNIAGAFEIGSSTKGHSGHGLPAAKAAMLSLSGKIEMIPQEDKGCAVNLSWPVLGAES